MWISKISLPPLFHALILYDFCTDVTLGVPEITPVELSIFRPFGSEGEMLHTAESPEWDGVIVEMAASLLKVYGEPE
jgi:hypothetical protein